jgi:hypothetical protein
MQLIDLMKIMCLSPPPPHHHHPHHHPPSMTDDALFRIDPISSVRPPIGSPLFFSPSPSQLRNAGNFGASHAEESRRLDPNRRMWFAGCEKSGASCSDMIVAKQLSARLPFTFVDGRVHPSILWPSALSAFAYLQQDIILFLGQGMDLLILFFRSRNR